MFQRQFLTTSLLLVLKILQKTKITLNIAHLHKNTIDSLFQEYYFKIITIKILKNC